MNDEFYIGYEPAMPPQLARRVRAAAIVLILLAPVVSGILVLAQGRFSSANFEFGRTRTFEGTLVEYPSPALLERREDTAAAHVYWLVGPGKHGAAEIVKGRDGQRVRLSGSLIERDDDRMIEVSSSDVLSPMDSKDTLRAEPLRSLGALVVLGEIVDSKCHLGVMKPGEGPTHRDCATRCLLGRITPMFVPARGDTRVGRLPLVDPDGRPFSGSLETVTGRPVMIRGELLARGPLRFLAASDVTKTAPAS